MKKANQLLGHMHTHIYPHTHRERQKLNHPPTAASDSSGTTKETNSQGHCIVSLHNTPDETENIQTLTYTLADTYAEPDNSPDESRTMLTEFQLEWI